MELSLRDLQLLAESEYSIEKTREDLNAVVAYFKSLPYHDQAIDAAFVQGRELPKCIADEVDVFFIDEDIAIMDIPEDYRAEALGLVRKGHITMEGRLVYPVKDVKGNVMGFCGWDPFESPKYLDSRNHGYKAKYASFYGMEMLPVYYRNNLPIYVVEGIVDCLYLRSVGLQAIALLTSSLTKYVCQIIKRFEDRAVFIPDNDAFGKKIEEIDDTVLAGDHFAKFAKRFFPRSTVIQPKLGNDVDELRKIDGHRYEQKFIYELKQVALCPFMPFETIIVR